MSAPYIISVIQGEIRIIIGATMLVFTSEQAFLNFMDSLLDDVQETLKHNAEIN